MGGYQDPRKAELLPGTLEMLILKSLERNVEPMHGYGIALYLRQISNYNCYVELKVKNLLTIEMIHSAKL